MTSPYPPTPETRSLRQTLGEFATGVTVVTAVAADGSLAGLTVNSFASVSLEPPLVLWSLTRNAPSQAVFDTATHYAVNVLAAEQQELSQHFARHRADKFVGVDWKPGIAGVPLLPGCCAWFECRIVERIVGGDHLIMLGEVERFHREHKAPLLFYAGHYRSLA